MAAFALIVWPFLAMAFFAALGPKRGLIWSVLIGYLFLPERFTFDLPGLPPYGKTSAISIGVLFGLAVSVLRGEAATGAHPAPQAGTVRLVTWSLIALMLLSPLVTMVTNREALVYGPTVVPGLGIRDAISMIWDSVVVLIPILAARYYLRDEEMHREVLRAIVVGGLVYSLLALFEMRMSPQLHQWVYGYFQHSWNQHVRGGHYRPIIFLTHGLAVGFLFFMAVMAATALLRRSGDDPPRLEYLLAGSWLFLVLVLSRNLGATTLAVLLVPLLLMGSRKLQIWVARVVVLLFLSMPVLRQADLLPLDAVVAFAGKVSEARAQSLAYRFENEADFLARANEKPLAGWGIWARWRIWSEGGYDVSTSDGAWVSQLGERGWLGYAGFFGLLSVPLLFMGGALKRRPVSMATIGMVAISAGNMLYMIPNSGFSALDGMLVGGLIGFILSEPARAEAGTSEPAEERGKTPRYTRFPETQPVRLKRS